MFDAMTGILIDRFQGLMNYLDEGGTILVPLICISIWMWYLIIKKLRLISLCRAAVSPTGSIRMGKTLKKPGPGSTMMEEFTKYRTHNVETDKKLLHAVVQKEQAELDRHIQTVFVLASTAPLLGLLGTVTGMISTFEAISRFGTSNAKALAAGISEALITTQIGLVIAIPGLFMGNFIRRRIDAFKQRLERFYLEAARNLSMGGRIPGVKENKS